MYECEYEYYTLVLESGWRRVEIGMGDDLNDDWNVAVNVNWNVDLLLHVHVERRIGGGGGRGASILWRGGGGRGAVFVP